MKMMNELSKLAYRSIARVHFIAVGLERVFEIDASVFG